MNYKDGRISINSTWATVFRTVIIVGIIAHGYMLFNKLSYHDDIYALFSLGSTYGLGRWGVGIVTEIIGSSVGLYSTPVFTGSISIILLGVSAALVCDILKIKSRLGATYIGAIMVSFPVVASIFAYMFMAGIYFAALFLSVLAVYILSEYYNAVKCLAAACLIAICIGIYQAFLASSATLMVMTLIVHVLDDTDKKIRGHLEEALVYAITLISGTGIYFIVNKVCLRVKKVNLSSYQGINGHYDISQLPRKVIDVYHSFLGGGYEGINGQHLLSNSVKVIIILTIVGAVLIVFKNESDRLCKFWMMLLLLVFPLAAYLVKLYSTEENYIVHTLMVYSLVYVYILPVCVLERMNSKKVVPGGVALQIGKYILVMALSMLVFIYVYYDNVAYLKMNFVQEQTISYFNTLITRIESVDGYHDEYAVVLLGYDQIEDKNFFSSKEFSRITYTGYDYTTKSVVNDYANISYLRYHMGYDPDTLRLNDSDYWQLEEVQNMNCYPDDGSIKVIDEAIVVKFAEQGQ